jgi:hypothetical protein
MQLFAYLPTDPSFESPDEKGSSDRNYRFALGQGWREVELVWSLGRVSPCFQAGAWEQGEWDSGTWEQGGISREF